MRPPTAPCGDWTPRQRPISRRANAIVSVGSALGWRGTPSVAWRRCLTALTTLERLRATRPGLHVRKDAGLSSRAAIAPRSADQERRRWFGDADAALEKTVHGAPQRDVRDGERGGQSTPRHHVLGQFTIGSKQLDATKTHVGQASRESGRGGVRCFPPMDLRLRLVREPKIEAP